MSIYPKISHLLLAFAFGHASAANQIVSADEKPIQGRVTEVVLPSYRIIQDMPEKCWGDKLNPKKICISTRVIELLETSYPTKPMAWDSESPAISPPLQISVQKPAYVGVRELYKPYIETTLCEPVIAAGKCVTTRTLLEGVRVGLNFE